VNGPDVAVVLGLPIVTPEFVVDMHVLFDFNMSTRCDGSPAASDTPGDEMVTSKCPGQAGTSTVMPLIGMMSQLPMSAGSGPVSVPPPL
jgi:hypothetical protein